MRHERLGLPDEHARAVQEGNEHARADILPPAGGRMSPSCRLDKSKQVRRKTTYKRERVRGAMIHRAMENVEML
jgi:hypothetical protein